MKVFSYLSTVEGHSYIRGNVLLDYFLMSQRPMGTTPFNRVVTYRALSLQQMSNFTLEYLLKIENLNK